MKIPFGKLFAASCLSVCIIGTVVLSNSIANASTSNRPVLIGHVDQHIVVPNSAHFVCTDKATQNGEITFTTDQFNPGEVRTIALSKEKYGTPIVTTQVSTNGSHSFPYLMKTQLSNGKYYVYNTALVNDSNRDMYLSDVDVDWTGCEQVITTTTVTPTTTIAVAVIPPIKDTKPAAPVEQTHIAFTG
jgi:hypothetical protein